MDERVKQRIATRFAVLNSLGQSNTPLTADHITIKEIPERSRTRAEVTTTGSQLRVHPNTFPDSEVEHRIVTYVHEIAHIGMGGAHHKPKYWNHFAKVCNNIIASDTARRVVESVFVDDIDWHKVRYRAVQDVNDKGVDNRMETVEERQRELSRALDTYTIETTEYFDLKRYSWRSGEPGVMFHEDDYTETISIDDVPVSASDYTDEELRAFIEEHGEQVDAEHTTFTAPITYTDDDRRGFVDTEYAHKMIGVCGRIGMDYCPMTVAQAVVDEVDEFGLSDSQRQTCENII